MRAFSETLYVTVSLYVVHKSAGFFNVSPHFITAIRAHMTLVFSDLHTIKCAALEGMFKVLRATSIACSVVNSVIRGTVGPVHLVN